MILVVSTLNTKYKHSSTYQSGFMTMMTEEAELKKENFDIFVSLTLQLHVYYRDLNTTFTNVSVRFKILLQVNKISLKRRKNVFEQNLEQFHLIFWRGALGAVFSIFPLLKWRQIGATWQVGDLEFVYLVT